MFTLDPPAASPPRPPPRGRLRALARRAAIAAIAGLGVLILCILSMRWIPPVTTAFMVRERITTGPIQQRWVPADLISDEVAIAVVASEDQRFPEHWGIDLRAVKDALDEPGKPRRGASTLSQQVAKNLFLWPGGGYLRKGIEAGLTVLIEALWPKERILLVYLNVAEFAPGVFGVEAASQHAFGKPAARLTRPEAAGLAAARPGPKRRALRKPSRFLRGQPRRIEREIRNLGGPAYLVDKGAWR